MSERYIAVLAAQSRTGLHPLHAVPGYSTVFEHSAVAILSAGPSNPVRFDGNHGLAIGTMFSRADFGLVDQLGSAAVGAALRSDGASLVDLVWGGYVAFLVHESGCVTIARDPSGAVPCYVVRQGDTIIATSDLRACVEGGLIRADVDWDAIAAHLVWPERRTPRTCLTGVRELMPGGRLRLDGHAITIDEIWRPWTFTSAGQRIDARADAVATVRDAALGTVRAWTKRYPRPLVTLSGGLDSSIVLAGAGSHAHAVTISTDEPLGDERSYARAVADHCGVPLRERELRLDRIRPGLSNATPLPRPVSRLFAQEFDRIWRETGLETGADALFHGGGGDNVFCYLASSTPYLDSLLARGPGRRSAETLDSLSRLTKVSRWQIRRAALRKIAVDYGRYRWVRDVRLLTRAAIRAGRDVEGHPWFRSIPARTLPGKQAHVAALVRIQPHLEAIEPRHILPVVAPLMSQLVIEACLRVPTWLWCEDGTNRAIARHAFRDLLPKKVIDRRTKGSPAAFDARVIATHHDKIRNLLMDGHLAREGVIDRDAVAAALDVAGPIRGDLYLRIGELVDVEAWVQSWIGNGAAGEWHA